MTGPVLPERILGRDIFWWFENLRTMGLSADGRLGARIRAQNPIIGTDVRRLLRTVRRGAPVHRGGVTSWPGLFSVGLPWQRARGFAVLGWVGRDAEVVAGQVTAG